MKILTKIYVTALLLAGMMVYVNGQQTPVYSQYMINKFLINPAVAGGNGISTINMVARQQFVGFNNPPRTFALSGQTRLLNNSYILRALKLRKDANQASRIANIGLGANIYSDRNGIVTKTGIQLTYAYHINFNNEFQLSMGLSGSAFQYKLDDSNVYLHDPVDGLLDGKRKQFWVPDATAGLYVTNSKLFAGATLTDLFGSGIKLGKDIFKDNFSTARNFNVMGGYKFDLVDNFSLEPSFLLRANKFDFQTDINTKLLYLDEYWLGVSYRTDNTIIAMVGMNIDMFYFGYAYDASMGTIRNYNSGSHEIMLGLRFGNYNVRRFRWLKKDETEFDL